MIARPPQRGFCGVARREDVATDLAGMPRTGWAGSEISGGRGLRRDTHTPFIPAEAGTQTWRPSSAWPLGPRFRGDERRMLLRTHSHIQFSNGLSRSVKCIETKENRPLFAALGQGVALIALFRLPRNRGGWRATRRMAWITPDRPGS